MQNENKNPDFVEELPEQLQEPALSSLQNAEMKDAQVKANSKSDVVEDEDTDNKKKKNIFKVLFALSKKVRIIFIALICFGFLILLAGIGVLVYFLMKVDRLNTPTLFVSNASGVVCASVSNTDVDTYYFSVNDFVFKSDKNCVDITSLCSRPGVYSVKVAISGENPKSKSEFSEPVSVTVTKEINVNDPTMAGTVVCWESSTYVKDYSVILDGEVVIEKTNNLSYDFSLLQNISEGEHSVSIRYNSNSEYVEGYTTENVRFEKPKTLADPAGSFDKTTKILTINNSGAERYFVYVNNAAKVLEVQRINEQSLQIDLSQHYSQTELEALSLIELEASSGDNRLHISNKVVIYKKEA